MQTKCHLSILIHEQAKKYNDRRAITYHSFGSRVWKTLSWNEFSGEVMRASNAMLSLNIKPQENIAVCSQNCKEYLITDFGAYGIRAVSIPFYSTASEQQMQYMINDAQIRFMFVGEQAQYDKAHRIQPLCHSLERIVVFDESVRISTHDPNAIYFKDFMALGNGLTHQAELENRWAEANEEDLCNVLYTSGTTGESKGVMLSYLQYHAAMRENNKCVPIDERDRIINFLPFTHIFERAWTYLAITEGCELIINTDPREIQQSMAETHPTCMCSVPRFWEKVYIGIKEHINGSSPIQKNVFKHALAVAHKHNIYYLSNGKRPPLALKLQYAIVNKTVLSLVRKRFGLDNPNIFPTAGAAVSAKVEEFVHTIGLNMLAGYGLTESLATVSCDHLGEKYTLGSVGRLIEDIQIKFGENNEVMLKGPTITKGYYKREDLNSKIFDEEGYFHTGDAGYMKDGELFLTDRIKDLFKTSNGKYIAPQKIEALLLVDKFIEQVAVIANEKQFVSALIVPEYNLLEAWARDYNIEFGSREDLCADEKVQKMMFERIHTLQQQLASYEQIKRITLLPHHFSMENQELTNTLKLRRSNVYTNYKKVIDKMYEV